MTRRLLSIAFGLATLVAPARAQWKPTMVILVRHAEKAAEPAADPPLTEAGAARARALAAALEHARVQAVITTELTRTRETARPVAEADHLSPEVVHSGPRAEHVKAVAAAVRRHEGETILVVGHSNTVPAIIAALGGPTLPDICDSQYSTLYVLYLDGSRASLVTSSYGAPSPDPAATCPRTMK